MTANFNIGEIEARCWEIQNSPYLRKDPPPELMKLRSLLGKVDQLTSDDVPSLISEIKRLRAQNRKLEQGAAAREYPDLDRDEAANAAPIPAPVEAPVPVAETSFQETEVPFPTDESAFQETEATFPAAEATFSTDEASFPAVEGPLLQVGAETK